MVTKLTEGVCISVLSSYRGEEVQANNVVYAFTYKIKIENLSKHPIQLLSRFWEIVESSGIVKIVEGEGVIGQQPLLYPGESFEYTSGSLIQSELGKMSGHYVFENKFNKEIFQVIIPTFHLVLPRKMN